MAAAVGCTTDDPGKKECEIGTNNPDLECVAGYECKCSPDGCFCEKVSKLTVQSRPPPQTLVRKDHNIEYLKRLGFLQPDD